MSLIFIPPWTLPVRAPGQSLPDAFALVVQALRQALFIHCGPGKILAPIMMLLLARLSRAVLRFAAIAARYAAGKPPIVRRPSAASLKPRLPAKPHGTPRGFRWLLRLLGPPPLGPVATAQAASLRLEVLMADPEMAAFLAACPQAARVLRPICRMLGIAFPPAAPRKRRAQAPPPEPGIEAPEPQAALVLQDELATHAARVAPEPAPPALKPRRPPRRRVPFALRRSPLPA